MVPLCRQLATAYDAGIPILKSFDMVTRQTRDPRIKKVITEMGDAIRNGETLGAAARSQSKYLPTFFIELISTGEMGGRLDVMLRDLAKYFEDRLNIQREIQRALLLPGIQIVAAWFLGSFALMLLGKISFSLDKATANTNPMAMLEAFFMEYLFFQAKVLLGVGVVVAACVVLSRLGLFGWIWGAFATHIWPFSNVTCKFGLARFFRSMSLLIGSGMRIDHCIASSAKVTANPFIERDLLKALPTVREGGTLVEAFSRTKYLTPTAREMILVGEQAGQLETSLHKVAELHLDEASHAVSVMTKVLGVLIVLAVALVIGYVIITFYMRIYGGMLDALDV